MKMLQSERILRFLGNNIVFSLLFALSVHGQEVKDAKEENGFVLDKIIGKVDNYIVLKSELEAAYQNYLTEGNPGSDQAKCSLLNRMVMNKLMVAKAEIDSVLVTDAEVDQNTTQRMA